jgi:hypothetical protein
VSLLGEKFKFSVELQQHIHAGTAVRVGACVCMRVHVMAYVWKKACVYRMFSLVEENMRIP